MKKRLTSIFLAVAMTLNAFSSFAGQWIKNGNWYYLDDNGVMMTNSWTPDGYYVGADGAWTGQSANNNSQNSQNVSEIKDPVGIYVEDDGVTMVYDENGPLIGYVEIAKNEYGTYDIDIVESYKGAPYGTVDSIYANIPFYLVSEYKGYISTHTLLFDGYNTISVACEEDQKMTVYHRINDDIRNHINYNY